MSIPKHWGHSVGGAYRTAVAMEGEMGDGTLVGWCVDVILYGVMPFVVGYLLSDVLLKPLARAAGVTDWREAVRQLHQGRGVGNEARVEDSQGGILAPCEMRGVFGAGMVQEEDVVGCGWDRSARRSAEEWCSLTVESAGKRRPLLDIHERLHLLKVVDSGCLGEAIYRVLNRYDNLKPVFQTWTSLTPENLSKVGVGILRDVLLDAAEGGDWWKIRKNRGVDDLLLLVAREFDVLRGQRSH